MEGRAPILKIHLVQVPCVLILTYSQMINDYSARAIEGIVPEENLRNSSPVQLVALHKLHLPSLHV